MNDIYTLDCEYFDKTFKTLENLIDYVRTSGMDPNYEVLKNGKPTGDLSIDLL